MLINAYCNKSRELTENLHERVEYSKEPLSIVNESHTMENESSKDARKEVPSGVDERISRRRAIERMALPALGLMGLGVTLSGCMSDCATLRLYNAGGGGGYSSYAYSASEYYGSYYSCYSCVSPKTYGSYYSYS